MKFLWSLTMSLGVSISLASCSLDQTLDGVNRSASGQPGGIIDASGGNLPRSTNEMIDKVLAELPDRLSRVVNRMAMLDSEAFVPKFRPSFARWLESDDFSSENYGFRVTRRIKPSHDPVLTRELKDSFLFGKNTWGLRGDQFLRLPHVRIERREGPCLETPHGPRDASAKPDGAICFSLPSLRKVDPAILPIVITSLAAHEVAHLLNFEEKDAQALQDIIEWDRETLFVSREDTLLSLTTIAEIRSLIDYAWTSANRSARDPDDETPDYEEVESFHDKIDWIIQEIRFDLRVFSAQGRHFTQANYDESTGVFTEKNFLDELDDEGKKIKRSRAQEKDMMRSGKNAKDALKMITSYFSLQSQNGLSFATSSSTFDSIEDFEAHTPEQARKNFIVEPTFPSPRWIERSTVSAGLTRIEKAYLDWSTPILRWVLGPDLDEDELDWYRSFRSNNDEYWKGRLSLDETLIDSIEFKQLPRDPFYPN